MPKIKITPCYDFYHTYGQSPPKTDDVSDNDDRWRIYWNLKITRKGTLIYKCKQCVYSAERKKKLDEKYLSDEHVINKLKMGEDEQKQISPVLIELKRATLRLNYLIKTPVVRCKEHGDLFVHMKGAVIKAGRDPRGDRRYKCRLCMKIFHKIHYENNKDKVSIAQKKYREENPEKVKETKRVSAKKMRNIYRERHIQRRKDERILNPYASKERQKRYRKKSISELGDPYVKEKLVDGTSLKFDDIPQEMVDAQREVMRLRRIIKNTQSPLKELLKKKRIR